MASKFFKDSSIVSQKVVTIGDENNQCRGISLIVGKKNIDGVEVLLEEDELKKALKAFHYEPVANQIECKCPDCGFFPKPNSKKWAEEGVGGRNLCERGRPMSFKMPEAHPDINGNWGFYHKGCRLFIEKEDA